MNCAIYAIENHKNGKKYIGSSFEPNKRKIRHWYHLRHGKHVNAHLQRAWNKDGENAFVFSVLEVIDEPSLLREREQWWIDHLDPQYNIATDTRCPALGQIPWNKGVSISEETKQKISKAMMGRPGSMNGKHHSHETRHKISVACQLVEHGEEWCKKIGDALRGKHRKPTWTDRKHTDESRAKISAARKGLGVGSENNAAKLTETDVREIKIYLKAGESGMSIARRFRVSKITIYRIRDGKTWSHVLH